jgi:nitrogen fixation protein FixH
MNAGSTLNGRHVLMVLLAFFTVFIIVNIAFAVVAVRSFPGEDVPRSYLQGLAYNDTLDERRAQAELGWSASAGFSRAPDGAAILQIDLRARDGDPVTTANIAGDLRRTTTSRFDQELTFAHAGDGRYTAHLAELPAGRWVLRARAEEGSASLDFEADLTWP